MHTYHSYVFQINITHAVALRKEGSKKTVLCYHLDSSWEDDNAKINDNEVINGWCGTCKPGAKKNCKSLRFIY